MTRAIRRSHSPSDALYLAVYVRHSRNRSPRVRPYSIDSRFERPYPLQLGNCDFGSLSLGFRRVNRLSTRPAFRSCLRGQRGGHHLHPVGFDPAPPPQRPYQSRMHPSQNRYLGYLVHRLIRSVHKDMKSANVFKLLESIRVNHSSVSVH